MKENFQTLLLAFTCCIGEKQNEASRAGAHRAPTCVRMKGAAPSRQEDYAQLQTTGDTAAHECHQLVLQHPRACTLAEHFLFNAVSIKFRSAFYQQKPSYSRMENKLKLETFKH